MELKELYRILLTVFVIAAAIYKFPESNKREKIAMIILVSVLIIVTLLYYV